MSLHNKLTYFILNIAKLNASDFSLCSDIYIGKLRFASSTTVFNEFKSKCVGDFILSMCRLIFSKLLIPVVAICKLKTIDLHLIWKWLKLYSVRTEYIPYYW